MLHLCISECLKDSDNTVAVIEIKYPLKMLDKLFSS